MAQKTEKGFSEISVAIHQYYMDIINCMPNIVYWIDLNCELKGSNNNFVKLLGLDDLQDFTGTAYELLSKYAHWPISRVETFKLDDMKVIFSGKPQYNVDESYFLTKQNKKAHYLSTRVPLLDNKKQVIGLVVILTDITDRQNKEERVHHVSSLNLREIKQINHQSPRVLMVEDNLIAQKVEQALLMTLGCDVDMADTGEMALSLFEPGKYDIVLMDIGLQDTSGYIVAKKLREKEKNTGHYVPIVALTSYQADIVKYDCRDYLMDGVITKPLTVEQAEQIIQHYVYHQDTVIDGLACD